MSLHFNKSRYRHSLLGFLNFSEAGLWRYSYKRLFIKCYQKYQRKLVEEAMFGNVTSVRHSSIIHKLLIFFEISFSEEDLRVIAGMLKLKLK